MGRETGISWTDSTWNPIRGCTPVSPGCKNCYASKVARRFSGPGGPYEGLVRINAAGQRTDEWNGNIKFVEEHLFDPLRWKKPRRIFVNSMSDLFHENVTDEMRDKIFAVMALSPQHAFQVLTKRPGRMLEYLESACGRIADLVMKMRADRGDRGCVGPLPHIAPGATWWPLANVWLGVSVEDQKTADERIPLLLQAPAAALFISAEPLLGPIDLVEMKNTVCRFNPLPAGYEKAVAFYLDALRGCRSCVLENCDGCREEDGWIPKLDWVIVGGESGPGARPMHPDWVRDLRHHCKAAGVPFFFKQWGEYGAGSIHMTSGEQVFRQFDSFQHWVNKASTWVNGGICIDADGVRLETGGGFKVARYPVTIMHRVGTKAAGCLLDGVEHHEFPAVQA